MNFSEKNYARVSFDCVDYILHASKTRVYVYSANNLDLIDVSTLRFYLCIENLLLIGTRQL